MPADRRNGNASDISDTTEKSGGSASSPEAELDGVQVHYHSPLPGRVNAEAFTQGDHIYLAAGQERHLPHELGHVMGYSHDSSFTYGPWAQELMNNFYVEHLGEMPIDSSTYLNTSKNPTLYP